MQHKDGKTRRSGPKDGGRAGKFLEAYALALLLVLMIGAFSIALPDSFATQSNFVAMASTVSVLMIVALGLTVPLSAGDFDLSVASMVGLSAGILGRVATDSQPLVLGVTLALCAGLLVGAVNGFLVVRVGVNAFITTLGTGTVLIGMTLAVTDSQTLFVQSEALTTFATTEVLGVPIPVFYGLFVALVLWIVLDHTPTGRRLYMTGEGMQAARLSGIRIDRIRFGAFLVSGLLSAFAGLVVAGQLGAADPNIGETFLLPAFAAAFLGATAVKTGRFNVWGTVLAVYFVQVGVTGLQLLGSDPWISQVFNGGVLVTAVAVSMLLSKRA